MLSAQPPANHKAEGRGFPASRGRLRQAGDCSFRPPRPASRVPLGTRTPGIVHPVGTRAQAGSPAFDLRTRPAPRPPPARRVRGGCPAASGTQTLKSPTHFVGTRLLCESTSVDEKQNKHGLIPLCRPGPTMASDVRSMKVQPALRS